MSGETARAMSGTAPTQQNCSIPQVQKCREKGENKSSSTQLVARQFRQAHIVPASWNPSRRPEMPRVIHGAEPTTCKQSRRGHQCRDKGLEANVVWHLRTGPTTGISVAGIMTANSSSPNPLYSDRAAD